MFSCAYICTSIMCHNIIKFVMNFSNRLKFYSGNYYNNRIISMKDISLITMTSKMSEMLNIQYTYGITVCYVKNILCRPVRVYYNNKSRKSIHNTNSCHDDQCCCIRKCGCSEFQVIWNFNNTRIGRINIRPCYKTQWTWKGQLQSPGNQ